MMPPAPGEAPTRRAVGLLLAGGAGRRFGGAKQVATLDGKPLIRHALDALLGAQALAEVLVVTGAHARAVQAVLGSARTVHCAGWAEGMAASLRTGLAAAGAPDLLLLALGDQPGISPELVDAVVAAGLAQPQDGAARAVYAGVPGHPVAFRPALFPPLAALTGDRGGRDVLASTSVARVEVGHLGDPRDVDTPAALS